MLKGIEGLTLVLKWLSGGFLGAKESPVARKKCLAGDLNVGLHLSICVPMLAVPTCPGCTPPSPEDSWNRLDNEGLDGWIDGSLKLATNLPTHQSVCKETGLVV